MKEISESMLKVFKEIEDIKKNKVNPFYNSNYADLDGIVKKIKPILVKYGIFFRQICHPSETHAIVETIIHHESGQLFECGPCSVPAKKLDPQQYGSAFTYARRYSLTAAFGITTEDDDDGNTATKPEENKSGEKTSGMGECPECGVKAIIKGKADYGGGHVCWKQKDGCGAKFNDDMSPKDTAPPKEMTDQDKARACWSKIKESSRKHLEGLSQTEKTEVMKEVDFDAKKIDLFCDKETEEVEEMLERIGGE